MNTLNRYILKKFIGPFITIFSLLCIIIFVSQVLERLDRFLVDGVTFQHVMGYLISSMPVRALEVLPVSTFMATLFVVGNLARTKEYIAGLAGGVAPEKFLGGLFWAGLFISLGALVANETVIPPATRYSKAVYREKIRRLGSWRQVVFQNLFVSGSDGRIWNTKLFNQDEGRMERVLVDQYKDGRVGEQIDALRAQWSQSGWTFQDGVVRTFGPDGNNIVSIEAFDEKTFSYAEKPTDLVTQEPQAEQMNYKTLKRHIKRLDALGIPVRKLEVELMNKLAFPFACFIVTLLGVPLAMRGKGSLGWGIATALVLTFIYIAFMEFGNALAQRFIPPLVGAWLGNVTFLAIGLTLWFKMRRTA